MINNYSTHIIGSRNPRIEIRTSLDGILMSQEEIEQQERASQQKREAKRKSKSGIAQPDIPQNVTRDNNPPQATPTTGWLYVSSIGMEFAPTLDGFSSNWYDAHKLVKSKGLIMPSPEETWALIFEAKARLDEPEFRKIYEFFTKKTLKDTWHGEWQDAYFKEEKGKMYMHRFKGLNKKGEPEFHTGVDITGTYLANDGYANISQRANITPQGLCKVADSRTDYVNGENIYSMYLGDGAVAGFGAGSGGAGLYCNWDPSGSFASLGVRYARRVAPSVVGNNGGKK